MGEGVAVLALQNILYFKASARRSGHVLHCARYMTQQMPQFLVILMLLQVRPMGQTPMDPSIGEKIENKSPYQANHT